MKQTKTKRLLSLVIAAMMILTLIPAGAFSVFAADAEAPAGSGTEADPYLIDDKATWEYISNNATTYSSVYLKLTADIIATEEGEELRPLMGKPKTETTTGSKTFSGTLDGAKPDGGKYKISGFTTGVGGFIVDGSMNGTIKNIEFDNMTVSYSYATSTDIWYVGLISKLCAGNVVLENIDVNNCSIPSGTNNSEGYGGLIGKINKATSFYAKSVNVNNLNLMEGKNRTDGTGAIVGFILGTDSTAHSIKFEDCHVKNSIMAGDLWVGAMVGGVEAGLKSSTVEFKNCSATGNTVNGTTGVALLIGSVGNATTVNFIGCTVSGNATATTNSAGGFVGSYKVKSGTGGAKPTYTFDNCVVQGVSDTQPTVITCNGTNEWNSAAAFIATSRAGNLVIKNNSKVENTQINGLRAATIAANSIWGFSGDGTLTANVSDMTVRNVTVNGTGGSAALFCRYTTSGKNQPVSAKVSNTTLDNVTVTGANGVEVSTENYLVDATVRGEYTGLTIANSKRGEIAGFVEQTADGEGVRHYRFAALTTADREAYDMKVTAVYDGYNYEWVADENSALETLDVYNGLEQDMGIDADTLDGKKFIAVVIENGPMAAIEFVVSISYTDGEITWTEYRTLSFDANGECAQSVSMA